MFFESLEGLPWGLLIFCHLCAAGLLVPAYAEIAHKLRVPLIHPIIKLFKDLEAEREK